MIEDMDIIMTDAGQIVLVVPGVIPEGGLELGLLPRTVTLAAEGEIFARVGDIDDMVMDTLAAQTQIDLIAVPDDEHPPEGITHYAHVKDYR